jgi:hypothetical protein
MSVAEAAFGAGAGCCPNAMPAPAVRHTNTKAARLIFTHMSDRAGKRKLFFICCLLYLLPFSKIRER